jgi:hypothetical protein
VSKISQAEESMFGTMENQTFFQSIGKKQGKPDLPFLGSHNLNSNRLQIPLSSFGNCLLYSFAANNMYHNLVYALLAYYYYLRFKI